MAAVSLPRAAAPARSSVAASASCLLLGQRPFLASPLHPASPPGAPRWPARPPDSACARVGSASQSAPLPTIIMEALLPSSERMEFPDPIVEVAINPKDEADADKMANGLTKLAWEIPSLQFSRDDMTVIKGTGELDLDDILERLKREFEVEVNVGYRQVVYREIISKTVEARYVYKLGEKFPRYADVTLRIEPMERGSGYEFKSEIKGGAEYVADVMKGIEYTLPAGILAGCPVVDIRVVLVDGSYRDGHARPFKIAARLALLQGLREAGPRLMEPVMRVQVITPGEHLDDVISSLTYATELKGYEQKPGGMQVVEALVPLARMFDYAYKLNRLSKGRASYTTQLAKFVAIPEDIQDQVSRERREWANRLREPQPRLSVAIADNYPIIRVAIEPKDKADAEKMENGLRKLAQEIPSIQFSRGYETALINGTGELHLDIIVERLRREFEVEVNVGYPQVVYREIISKIAEAQYIYKHGGTRPTYADVTLRIEPMERGSRYEFKSEIKGGAMPKEYVHDVMKGIEDTLPTGILAECPVVDLRVVLVDGSYRDSHERPFKIAANRALLQGLREAGPRLAEPVMRVEVITPEEHLDDVAYGLNARGELTPGSCEEKPGALQVVEALVPLESMLEFGNMLNNLSKGSVSYTMQLAKFVFVPQHIQDQISRERL